MQSNNDPASFRTIHPDSLPVSRLYGYLVGAVAPRPIALASTIDAAENVNLSPFSFFNVFSSNPPILVFSPARRSSDNTTKHTFDNLIEVPEVTINVVSYPIVEQMSLTSTDYDKGINEFRKSGLTEVPATRVRPPRILESPVSFECEVQEMIALGQDGGAGNLIICEVVLIHIMESCLDEAGRLDLQQLDLVGRMGGSWYTRASGAALFEINRPKKTIGIGVDQLPASVRNSPILTGNNLGRLGSLSHIPGKQEVDQIKSHSAVKAALSPHPHSMHSTMERLHLVAQKFLAEDELSLALGTLLFADQLDNTE